MKPLRRVALTSTAIAVALLGVTAHAHASHFQLKSHHGPSSTCTGQPVGVVSLGLCDVAVLKATNGARVATTNVAIYPSPPPGFNYSAGTQNTDVSADTTVNAINNSGHGGFYYSGTHTSTLTDFSLTSNSAITSSGFPLGTGTTSGGGVSGATNFDGEWGTIDGSGMLAGGTTMVQPHGLGTFKLAHVNLLHPARDHFVSADPGGTFIFDWDYLDTPCQNTTNSDHCEFLHFQTGGTYTITHTNLNATDGTDTGGNSGAIQAQTGVGVDPSIYTGGPMTLNASNNIFNYGCPLNQTTLSLKAVFDNITVNFGSNAVCPGSSAANHVIVEQADITVGSVTGTWSALENFTATGGKTGTEQGGLTSGSNLHLTAPGTGGTLVVGDLMTGSTSGATATVTAVNYHHVTINDLGGNLTFAGGTYTP